LIKPRDQTYMVTYRPQGWTSLVHVAQ